MNKYYLLTRLMYQNAAGVATSTPRDKYLTPYLVFLLSLKKNIVLYCTISYTTVVNAKRSFFITFQDKSQKKPVILMQWDLLEISSVPRAIKGYIFPLTRFCIQSHLNHCF